MAPQRRAHDLPLAHSLISAGAHGLRRIPGQSVNLAHLIWRTPRAPAPLLSGNKVHPRWFSARGYSRCLTPSVRFAASFPVNGEAACHNCSRVPLPRLRGFGACADAAEGGEGVFPPGSALVPILVKQGIHQNGAKGKGIWPLKRQSLRSCTSQPLDEETWQTHLTMTKFS